MKEIKTTLLAFSDQHHLWSLAEEKAIECLDNYFQEATKDELFSGFTSKQFGLQKKSQELIFWQYGSESFILRATFSIYKSGDAEKFPVGDYSLDVDESAAIVDDWLIFH